MSTTPRTNPPEWVMKCKSCPDVTKGSDIGEETRKMAQHDLNKHGREKKAGFTVTPVWEKV